jgi:hypothetical protein
MTNVGRTATRSGTLANSKRKLQRPTQHKRHHRAPAPDMRCLGFVVGSLCCLHSRERLRSAVAIPRDPFSLGQRRQQTASRSSRRLWDFLRYNLHHTRTLRLPIGL